MGSALFSPAESWRAPGTSSCPCLLTLARMLRVMDTEGPGRSGGESVRGHRAGPGLSPCCRKAALAVFRQARPPQEPAGYCPSPSSVLVVSSGRRPSAWLQWPGCRGPWHPSPASARLVLSAQARAALGAWLLPPGSVPGRVQPWRPAKPPLSTASLPVVQSCHSMSTMPGGAGTGRRGLARPGPGPKCCTAFD